MLSSANRLLMNQKAPLDPILGTQLHRTKNVVKGIYDFAIQGGAIGSVALVDDDGAKVSLPAGAIVMKVLVEVKTAPLSAGSATLSLGVNSAVDLLAATAKASLSVGALLDGVPVNTAVTAVKVPIAADLQVKAAIAVAVLTVGRVEFFIEYVLGE